MQIRLFWEFSLSLLYLCVMPMLDEKCACNKALLAKPQIRLKTSLRLQPRQALSLDLFQTKE